MQETREGLRVEVCEKSLSNGDERAYTITVTAPNEYYQLTDVLNTRGVISSIEVFLERAIKEAVEEYFDSTERLILTIGKGENAGRKKRRRRRKDATSEHPFTEVAGAADN